VTRQTTLSNMHRDVWSKVSNVMTILHYDHKKSARIHHLWHYFIKDSKAQQAKKNAYNLFNIQFCFIFFAGLLAQFWFCGWKFPKLSVTGLIKRATRNCNCFLYGGCVNPGSVKVSAYALYLC